MTNMGDDTTDDIFSSRRAKEDFWLRTIFDLPQEFGCGCLTIVVLLLLALLGTVAWLASVFGTERWTAEPPILEDALGWMHRQNEGFAVDGFVAE